MERLHYGYTAQLRKMAIKSRCFLPPFLKGGLITFAINSVGGSSNPQVLQCYSLKSDNLSKIVSYVILRERSDRRISKYEMLRCAQHDKEIKNVGWALPTDSLEQKV